MGKKRAFVYVYATPVYRVFEDGADVIALCCK
jgi:hypothetical protein